VSSIAHGPDLHAADLHEVALDELAGALEAHAQLVGLTPTDEHDGRHRDARDQRGDGHDPTQGLSPLPGVGQRT
jgi:hypothetical protein